MPWRSTDTGTESPAGRVAREISGSMCARSFCVDDLMQIEQTPLAGQGMADDVDQGERGLHLLAQSPGRWRVDRDDRRSRCPGRRAVCAERPDLGSTARAGPRRWMRPVVRPSRKKSMAAEQPLRSRSRSSTGLYTRRATNFIANRRRRSPMPVVVFVSGACQVAHQRSHGLDPRQPGCFSFVAGSCRMPRRGAGQRRSAVRDHLSIRPDPSGQDCFLLAKCSASAVYTPSTPARIHAESRPITDSERLRTSAIDGQECCE